jgi:hypothetical protein
MKTLFLMVSDGAAQAVKSANTTGTLLIAQVVFCAELNGSLQLSFLCLLHLAIK